MPKPRRLWLDWMVDCTFRGLIWTALRLPYDKRVPMMGQILRVVGAATGYGRRANKQLSWIFPDMSQTERYRIVRAVLDNCGRMMVENYSTADQLAWAYRWEPHGPGLAACEAARIEGRQILFVSGHFGNYQAIRAAMNVRGYAIGGLYRLMNNPYFNAHYVASIEGVGGAAFPRNRRGLMGFVKNLRQGGHGAILIDQFIARGTLLDFLGQPAPTALSAAEMAVKYNALLVPVYATRLANGLDFDIEIEKPIPHSDVVEMTQALNDSLAVRVRDKPEQWLWIHRRWKPSFVRVNRSIWDSTGRAAD